jgi:organic hydroperoxide reductase OsmC/OhrA
LDILDIAIGTIGQLRKRQLGTTAVMHLLNKMIISAKVDSQFKRQNVTLKTGTNAHALEIPPKASGFGSSANGGEVLCLALATCYANDLYREAAKQSIEVVGVEVEVEAEFGAEGEPARHISYQVLVRAKASETDILDLITHTDRVAEVQNTLRLGMPVPLVSFKALSVGAD